MADWLMLPVVLLAAYALIACVPRRLLYERYTRILMAGLSTYYVAKIAGALWQPEARRPFESLGVNPGAAYLNNPGFPSDHVLLAGFLTFAVWYGTRNRNLTIAMAIMTVLVGLGRILALVHTPLDVVGGVVAAAIGAVWYIGSAKNKPHRVMVENTKK